MMSRIACSLVALNLLFAAACGEGESEIPVQDLESAVDAKADGLRTARFETFTGRDGRYYFHLLAANGQKVLHSQGYASRASATAGIGSVRTNAASPEAFDLLQARDGQWYFNLVAGNGKIIGSSELYTTKANAERAIAAVASLVGTAAVAPAPTGASFQIFKGLDGKSYFHLRAANGEIVLQSQGYASRTSATSGITTVLANGMEPERYQVKDAANGQAYFVLTSKNGRVIGVSETYPTRSQATAAADNVSTLIATAGR